MGRFSPDFRFGCPICVFGSVCAACFEQWASFGAETSDFAKRSFSFLAFSLTVLSLSFPLTLGLKLLSFTFGKKGALPASLAW